MGRITTDDDMDHDPRVMILKTMVGDIAALGSIVMAYRVAASYYVPDRKPIPVKLFKMLSWGTSLIDSGVAEFTEDETGVFIIKSEEQFGWLVSKHENGRKGGRPKEEPKETESKPKETEIKSGSESENDDNPLVTASASASAPAPVQIQNKESIGVGAVALTPPQDVIKGKKQQEKEIQKFKAGEFVRAYVKAYQSRFPERRPEDLNDGKTRGQILIWVKDYPLDRARELIQAYFQMESKWFGNKGYDFMTFRNNLNKVGQALDSGADPDGNAIDWGRLRAKMGVGDAVGRIHQADESDHLDFRKECLR